MGWNLLMRRCASPSNLSGPQLSGAIEPNATAPRLVSVAKGKIVRWNRGFWLFFSASFACHLMWGLTHLCDDSRQDRISCRYHSLDGERGGRAVAGVSWFAARLQPADAGNAQSGQ